MSTLSMRTPFRLGAALLLGGLLAGCSKEKAPPSAPPAPAVPGRQFATPEEAVAALVSAAEKFDVPELKSILGSDGEALVSSEDSVQDRNNSLAFAAQARAHQRLQYDSTHTSVVLSIGDGDWPAPIPLVQQGGKWSFDVAAGREEVLNRRIGRNELDAIQACRDYVAAQREYARARHDGAIVNQYAQHVISTAGKQDGLAWRNADGTWHGPMGEAMTRFISEGYTQRFEPFHGYYFKILKGQGPAAPLGEMDFLVKGAMIGGFALVAAPADYQISGVKSFIVGYDGIVYEKDLGEKSVEEFRAMERYNPDSTWSRVQEP